MFWKRVVYAILCVTSVIAFILTDSGVALFFCLCLGAFPILSMIFLVIAKRKFEFDFSVRSSCMRGGALEITMQAKIAPRFLAGYVSATGNMVNTTFDKTDRNVFTFQDLSNKPHTFSYVSADSGRIVVHFPKIRITDIFGICSVKVKCNKQVEAIVSPVLYEDITVRIGSSNKNSSDGELSLSKRGSDHTEIYGIRDYIPGDLMNSVHWKLSGKFGTLKTKEYGSSDDRRTLILVELSRVKKGNEVTCDEWLNCVLDVATSVSAALAKGLYAHTVGWFNNGKFICSDVTDNDSFIEMVEKLMSAHVSETGEEDRTYFTRSPEIAAFNKIIFTAADVDASKSKERTGYDLTILSVSDSANVLDEGTVKYISLPSENISAVLSACEL